MSAVGSMGGGGHGLGSAPHSSMLLWDNRLTSLSLGFLICKMGVWSRGGDWVEDAPWLVSGRLPSGTEMMAVKFTALASGQSTHSDSSMCVYKG